MQNPENFQEFVVYVKCNGTLDKTFKTGLLEMLPIIKREAEGYILFMKKENPENQYMLEM